MTNDITILSCPQCGFPKIRDCGNGLYQCDICETYFDKDENILLTEQEWLQTCDTEQLAEAIYKITKDNFKELRKLFYGIANDDCDAVALWLKQPHRPKE